MSFYALTRVSRNPKTGPIPVVTSSRDTCPTTCSFLGAGCYAEHGPLRLFWDKVSRGEGPTTLSFRELLKAIRRLPRGQVWRYGQAGDLPIDREDVRSLAKANAGRKVIAYTHSRQYETIREAATLGFNVNLSANNLDEADELAKTGLPVVVVIDQKFSRGPNEDLRSFRDRVGGNLSFKSPGGNRVAICPATYLETTCMLCKACSTPRVGGTIIGFPAHGSRKRKLSESLSVTGELSAWVRSRPSTIETPSLAA